MKEPVEHIERARIPWRRERLTECGRDVADVTLCITRDQAVAKAKELGRQRYAMVACMSCVETFGRHNTWAADPVGVLRRGLSDWGPKAGESARELRAIELLIKAHPEEWADTLAALETALPLSDAQARRTFLGPR